VKIVITGLDRALAVLAFDTRGLVRDACLAAAVATQDIVSVYPAARHGRQPFKTTAQRRAFFAKLRSGAIEVPYRRGTSPGSEN
jgi:hypothetical protein